MSGRRIQVGNSAKGAVSIDLDVLLRTRLLIQANSGGGKSWLLRRLAEQMFGRIPVIIIDPEGEFATLREKYGYVLVGQGGDTPADVRSAGLVAQRLLELRASAVCDLYEMKPGQRHEWVRQFLDALIDAPKKLWGPLIVLVDEAHLFCPEKGAGESVASEAMTALTTRGRKRGYCAVWATQRLAKLRKDAAAELQNVLIGPTFMDADRERAADALGVSRAERAAFFDQIKLLPEGNFFALGRAIALDRVLAKVGDVHTTHPEPGSTKHAAAPPPPPEKVKALLPKLADLPAEAEAKERTLAEMRADNARLKRELAEAKRAAPAAPKVETKTVERKVVSAADFKRAERLLERIEKIVERLGSAGVAIGAEGSRLSSVIASAMPPPYVHLSPRFEAPTATLRRASPPRTTRPVSPATNGEAPRLDKMQAAVLKVLATQPEGCLSGRLTLLAGYRWSGGFRNALSALRGLGLIDGTNGGVMRITDAGLDALGSDFESLPTGQALVEYWMRHPSLGTCERSVLAALIEEHPDGLAADELAKRAGYTWSGGFRNALSALRTAGLIVGRNTETMRVTEDFFR